MTSIVAEISAVLVPTARILYSLVKMVFCMSLSVIVHGEPLTVHVDVATVTSLRPRQLQAEFPLTPMTPTTDTFKEACVAVIR